MRRRKKNRTKRNLTFAVIGVILVILLAVFLGGLSVSSFYDDYTLYVDSNADMSSSTNLWDVSGSVVGSEESFRIGTPDKGSCVSRCNYDVRSGSVESTESFNNKYVKVDLDVYGQNKIDYQTRGNFELALGDVVILEKEFNCNRKCLERLTGRVEVVPELLDTSRVHVFWQGVETGVYVIPDDARLSINPSGNAVALVSDVKYKHVYSCEIENDEVPVKMVFDEGMTFDIHDLDPEPVKFCVDSYPALIRDFGTEGLATDVHAEITGKIANGESVTVAEGQAIYFYYIADYSEGMGERCGVGQALNLNTDNCEAIVTEEEDVRTMVRDVVELDLSLQERLFVGTGGENSYDLSIGDKELSVPVGSYVCTPEEAVYTAPEPSPDCWKASIEYDGKQNSVIWGEEVKLDDYVSVTYIPETRYDGGDVNTSDYIGVDVEKSTVKFKLKINMLEGLKIIPQKQDYFIKKSSDKELSFKITNSIASFTTEEAGVTFKKTKDLLFSQDLHFQSMKLDEGTTSQELSIDSEQYGEIIYQISPYILVENQQFTSANQLVYNFEVVDDIPEDAVFASEGSVEDLDLDPGFFTKIWNWLKSLIKR